MANKQANPQNTVLVVDDDSDALAELTEALLESDLRVYAAADGSRALDLAKRHRPAFVVMDYCLPGMNGADSIAAMRRFIPETTFIMISGSEAVHRAATTENTETVAVLKKPVSIGGITRFIKTKSESDPGKGSQVIARR